MKNLPSPSLVLFTLTVAALFPRYDISAHGVERGSVHQALQRESMLTELTKHSVAKEVEKRCDLKGGVVALDEARIVFDEIDQGQGDTYFTIALSVDFRGNQGSKMILVKGAEFDISNPAIDRVSIFSVESDLCPR